MSSINKPAALLEAAKKDFAAVTGGDYYAALRVQSERAETNRIAIKNRAKFRVVS